MHTGDLLAEMLARAGVRHVFGVPGGQTRPLYDGIYDRRPRIEHVLVRDERSGACAADAYARVSGSLGVCDATVGPGATNIVSGLAEALNSATPLLAIVADIPIGWEHVRRFGIASQGFQQSDSLRPVSKALIRLTDPATAAGTIADAMRTAVSGRPGPVVLEIPDDVFSAQVPEQPIPEVSSVSPGERPVAELRDVEAAISLLRDSRRPVIVVGSGAVASGAFHEVRELAEALGAPVLTSITGKGIVAETHPLAAGVAGVFGRTGANELLGAADTILAVGTKLGQLLTFSWAAPRAGQTVIQLDIDPGEIGRVCSPAASLCGDAQATLAVLLEHLPPIADDQRDPDWGVDAVARARLQWAAHNAKLRVEPGAVDPRDLVAALDAVMTDDDILVCDASLASGWGAAYWTLAQAGRRFLAPRGLAGIGWGGGAAVGAQAALGDAGRVFCLVGDGAWAYSMAEVETAVRQRLPIVWMVLNNGMLAWIQHGRTKGGRVMSSEFGPADYAVAAAAFGAWSSHLQLVDDPAEVLQAAAAQRRAAVVDVRSSSELSPVLAPPTWADGVAAYGR